MKELDCSNQEHHFKFEEIESFETLGRAVFNLAISAPMMGHTRPALTAKDYTGNATGSRPEQQFVGDLFRMKTEEFCEKWFGNLHNAMILKMELMQPLPYKR